MPDPMKVIILCRDRPLYLWASLDSLYRHTSTPVDVVIIDNNSQDPLVANVIGAFRRRGMFSEVIISPATIPILSPTLSPGSDRNLGPFFAYVEGDVVIEASQRCWVATMLEVMQSRPRLAMLGSQIDRSDFVDPALGRGASRLSPSGSWRDRQIGFARARRLHTARVRCRSP